MRFYTFRTYLDLGIFVQAFSSALKGSLFYETPDVVKIPSGSFLGTHFAPLTFLLVPIYAVRPGPETLLVLQMPFIALGALPIFLIARHVLRNESIALCVAGVYLVNPAIQSLSLFDFHLEAFLPFFLGMALYFLIRRKWRPYCLFLGLSLATIEFASIMIVAMSVGALVFHRERLKGIFSNPKNLLGEEDRDVLILLSTFVLAFAYFYFSLVASAIFAGTRSAPATLLGGFIPDPAQWLDAGFVPRMIFWLILTANLLFLPLKVLSRVLLVVPWFIVTMITSNPVYYAIGYQYGGAFVAPYLIIALVYALRELGPASKVRGLLASRLTVIILLSLIMTPLSPWAQGHLTGIVYEEGLPIATQHDAAIYRIMSLIPLNASILTQNNLFSHFSTRPNAYLYPPSNNVEISFILGDTTSRWYTSHVFGQESVSQVVPTALSSGLYTVIANQSGILLLERTNLVQSSSF